MSVMPPSRESKQFDLLLYSTCSLEAVIVLWLCISCWTVTESPLTNILWPSFITVNQRLWLCCGEDQEISMCVSLSLSASGIKWEVNVCMPVPNELIIDICNSSQQHVDSWARCENNACIKKTCICRFLIKKRAATKDYFHYQFIFQLFSWIIN